MPPTADGGDVRTRDRDRRRGRDLQRAAAGTRRADIELGRPIAAEPTGRAADQRIGGLRPVHHAGGAGRCDVANASPAAPAGRSIARAAAAGRDPVTFRVRHEAGARSAHARTGHRRARTGRHPVRAQIDAAHHRGVVVGNDDQWQRAGDHHVMIGHEVVGEQHRVPAALEEVRVLGAVDREQPGIDARRLAGEGEVGSIADHVARREVDRHEAAIGSGRGGGGAAGAGGRRRSRRVGSTRHGAAHDHQTQ
jgi:hypothetical protein